MRGARPGARLAAVLCAGAGAAAAFVLFLTGAIGGASGADRYGRVPLPGQVTLNLPAGDLAVYYEERVTLSENESLAVPDGLVVTASREGTIRSRRGTPNSISLDGRALREFGELRIPQAGHYRVTARSDAPGSNSPAVTLGEGQLASLGRAALRAGVALGAGLALALLILVLVRRGDHPPGGAPAAETPPPRATSIRL